MPDVDQIIADATGINPSFMQEAPEKLNRVRSLLGSGLAGAGVGAALGAGRQAIFGKKKRVKDYLRDTLAGALIGGLTTTGFKAIRGLEPWQQEAPLAQAVSSVRGTTEDLFNNPSALTGSSSALLGKYVTNARKAMSNARGDIQPEEQEDLTDKLLTLEAPTASGWSNRVNLLRRISSNMAKGSVSGYDVAIAKTFVRDPRVKRLLDRAEELSRSGNAQSPENQQILSAIGRRMTDELGVYDRAGSAFNAIRQLRSAYGTGSLSSTDVARRLGVLTGRFGGGDERVRDLVQNVLDKPLEAD